MSVATNVIFHRASRWHLTFIPDAEVIFRIEGTVEPAPPPSRCSPPVPSVCSAGSWLNLFQKTKCP